MVWMALLTLEKMNGACDQLTTKLAATPIPTGRRQYKRRLRTLIGGPKVRWIAIFSMRGHDPLYVHIRMAGLCVSSSGLMGPVSFPHSSDGVEIGLGR